VWGIGAGARGGGDKAGVLFIIVYAQSRDVFYIFLAAVQELACQGALAFSWC
jgi:hypothetical protein